MPAGPGPVRVRPRVALRPDAHGIYSLAAGPAARLAAGFGNGAVQVLDAASGRPGPALSGGHRSRHAVTALGFPPARPGLLLAASADGLVSLYRTEQAPAAAAPGPAPAPAAPLAVLAEKENEINAMDFCLDGSVFATAGTDRHIRLYDSCTMQLFHTLEAPDFMTGDVAVTSGHSRRIFALRFHPQENHIFLTGGWDNSVKVWDKRIRKEAQRVINGPHICGPGLDIWGHCVLTASWVPRNALQLWDLRTSQLQQNLPFPGGRTQGQFLYAARFCDPDTVLAGGSGTCGAGVIRISTHQVLGQILLPHKPVQAVAVACGGCVVAVAGVGGNLHIADLC